MPKTKKIHVCVSSTLPDKEQEQCVTHKPAFQILKNFCLRNYTKYEALDLSREVREEKENYQKIIQYYLNELARSKSVSTKPNYLNHFGDKYGRKLSNKKPVIKKFFHYCKRLKKIPDSIKGYNYQAVEKSPEMLREVGYEIVEV